MFRKQNQYEEFLRRYTKFSNLQLSTNRMHNIFVCTDGNSHLGIALYRFNVLLFENGIILFIRQ